MQLINTLLARNTAVMGMGNDCSGSVTSLGHNLIETTAGCMIIPQATDLVGKDPLLGPFTDEGAPGRGHFPLLPGSPAIDAGDDAVCPTIIVDSALSPKESSELAAPISSRSAAIFTDQLGKPRVGVCDIGAVEFQTTTLTVSLTSIPGTLLATWNGIATPAPKDWIGLFSPGAANTAYLDWIYVSCSQTAGNPQASGSCPFIVSASLAPGTYELRLIANNDFIDLLATSDTFTVATRQAGAAQ